MPKVKDIRAIKEKWTRVTPGRQDDFRSGVEAGDVQWAENTAAASGSYATGVQEAIAQNRFSKGVNRAGNTRWRKKTVELGVGRWGPGVRAAADDYAEGFQPFRDVIEGTTLPPRRPRGDPQNMERAAALAEALHRARVGS